jgi:hypothetical protein
VIRPTAHLGCQLSQPVGALVLWQEGRGGRIRRPARIGRRASRSGVDSIEVREWAKAQSIDVKDRGRVPAVLVVKFKTTTTQQGPIWLSTARLFHGHGHCCQDDAATSHTCRIERFLRLHF